MSTSLEVERKFSVRPGQPVPELSGIVEPGEPEHFSLRATYFDTPDLLLARNRRTLRRRVGGADEGWHLKLPGDGAGRHEIHEPLSAAPHELLVPAGLRARLAALIERRPLLPVATLETRRTQTPLLRDGAVVALLADDAVAADTIPSRHPQNWREIEVELAGAGDVALLDAIGRRFAAAGIAVSGSQSKLAQTLGDAVDAAADPTPNPSAGAVLAAYLRTQVGVLQSYQAELLVDAPDAVHKSRVATRRMRSALRSYAPLFDTSTRRVRTHLSWLADVLGAARDAEVLRDRLAGHHVALDWVLADRHSRAHAALVAAMGTRHYVRELAELTAFVAAPSFSLAANAAATEVLPRLLAKAEREPVHLVQRAHTATGDERLHLMHETRKAAKRARYAAEAAGAAGDASLWEAVTETLGQAQDCVVAIETLEPLIARHRGSVVADILAGVLDTERVAVENHIRDAEAAISRAAAQSHPTAQSHPAAQSHPR